MRILNVAEKPSVAKSISKILSTSCRSVRGKHKYCQNIFFDTEDKMVFTSVLGHLYTHDFQDKTRWDESNPYDLFEARIVRQIGQELQAVADNIKALAKECDRVVIWTDCDREGENIAMQIKSLLPGKEVKRARFSAISRQEIENALRNLVNINTHESDAVDARIELDLRIGSAFTRIQTLAFGEAMRSKARDKKAGVLSFGPCQIPTLNFVVQRHNEIVNFQSESFYTLENAVLKGADSITSVFKWARTRVFDRNCGVYFHRLLSRGAAVITAKTVENREKYRPLPLRTVEFQRVCSSYFKMPGHVLMTIAEKLYNNGYISYPRTETDAFPRNFGFSQIIKKLERDPVLGEYASSFGFTSPRTGKNDDQAHSPIYPLRDGASLAGEERKVYEFIARRFLGCISANAKGVETEYTMQISYANGDGAGGTEEFRCKGLSITERNYLDVYIYDKWESTRVGVFRINERVENNLSLVEGATSAPEYLTESDLISLMDKNGIGTDATIHEHIQKIQTRGYARTERFKIVPNTLGINLIRAYNQLELNVSEPTLRKNLEQRLKEVCAGVQDKEGLVREEIRLYRHIYKKFEDGIDLFKRIMCEGGDDPSDGRSSGGKAGDGVAGKGLKMRGSKPAGPKASGTKASKAANRPVRSNGEALGLLEKGHARSNALPTVAFKCECGKEAQRLIAKKGVNSGKAFYACYFYPKECDFFQWEDTVQDTSMNTENRRNALKSTRAESRRDYAEDLKCDCGSDSIKKVAHTEANMGREFYCCNRSYKKCKFFKWADE